MLYVYACIAESNTAGITQLTNSVGTQDERIAAIETSLKDGGATQASFRSIVLACELWKIALPPWGGG